jgi:hypothetical protein
MNNHILILTPTNCIEVPAVLVDVLAQQFLS